MLGVVSDTHGHASLAREAARMLQALEAEVVIHCGDIGTAEVMSLFSDWPSHFVYGNCDERRHELAAAVADGQHWHGAVGRIELAGRRIAFLHGADSLPGADFHAATLQPESQLGEAERVDYGGGSSDVHLPFQFQGESDFRTVHLRCRRRARSGDRRSIRAHRLRTLQRSQRRLVRVPRRHRTLGRSGSVRVSEFWIRLSRTGHVRLVAAQRVELRRREFHLYTEHDRRWVEQHLRCRRRSRRPELAHQERCHVDDRAVLSGRPDKAAPGLPILDHAR
ncbi:MAG: metallophosphatase family protein [Pirellulales bacterium]|nr:metallophosphatase family protein [Pirellulales bacterium]